MQLELDFGNTKVCNKCKETKDTGEFSKDKGKKDGLFWQCKSCNKEHHLKRITYFTENPPPPPATKQCTKCEVTKISAEFSKRKVSPDGLHNRCKRCDSVDNIDNRRKYTRRNMLAGPPDRTGTKKCQDCGETKQKTEFSASSDCLDGLQKRCKPCSSTRARQWRKDNPARNLANKARRRARKLRATPKFEDKRKTLWYYDESQRKSKETGVVHHVDHRVPLNHWSVRGLHWHGNFDVLPGAENSSKGNRFWPDDWHDYYHEFYDEFVALKEYALSLRKHTNRAPAAKAPTGTATTKPRVSASASPATRASGMTQIQEIQQI